MTFVGTEDFQGPAQWQSLALLQEARTIANLATFQWPAGGGTFPVSNWQSIQVGPTGSNAGIIDWIYQWYADSAGTILLGGRLLSTTAVGADFFTLGNLGPFLTITALNNSGGSRVVAMYATLTNRIQAPFAPGQSLPLLSAQNVNVGAGAALNVQPGYLYAGPATVWAFQNGAGHWSVELEGWKSAGQQAIIAHYDSVNFGTNEWVQQVILPPLAIVGRINNFTAGALNYYLVVTPDLFR